MFAMKYACNCILNRQLPHPGESEKIVGLRELTLQNYYSYIFATFSKTIIYTFLEHFTKLLFIQF